MCRNCAPIAAPYCRATTDVLPACHLCRDVDPGFSGSYNVKAVARLFSASKDRLGRVREQVVQSNSSAPAAEFVAAAQVVVSAQPRADLKCPGCSKAFGTARSLASHKAQALSCVASSQLVRCSECTYQTTPMGMKKHAGSSACKVTSHCCVICKRVGTKLPFYFDNAGMLLRHQRQKHRASQLD